MNIKMTDLILKNTRANLRIKENKRISWRIEGSELAGQGKVHNMSTSGMLLEANTNLKAENRRVISFHSRLVEDEFIPKYGRLTWSMKKSFTKSKYLCGIEFIEPSDDASLKLKKRIQRKIRNRLRLRRTVQCSLLTVLISLTVIILGLSHFIPKEIQASNQQMFRFANHQAILTQNSIQLYQESERKLKSTMNELNWTKLEFNFIRNFHEQKIQDISQELEVTQAILTLSQRERLFEVKDSEKLIAEVNRKLGTNGVEQTPQEIRIDIIFEETTEEASSR